MDTIILKKAIPNGLTLINLSSGCIATVMCFNGRLDVVYLLISISLLADYFDGFSARLLKTKSAVGKELDSLADLISFGMLPSCIIHRIVIDNTAPSTSIIAGCFSILPFIIVLFSALRLAKFNVDDRQTKDFIGLATPANTIMILGYYYLYKTPVFNQFFSSELAIVTICVLSSFLMVAPIPMFGFKMKTFKWNGNEFRYILIGISFILACVFGKQALFLVIMVYILLSVFKNLVAKKFTTCSEN